MASEESPLARPGRGPDPRTLLSEEAAELLGTRPPASARRGLAAIVLIALGAIAWASLGKVESRVVGHGALALEGDGSARAPRTLARVRVAASEAPRLVAGQRARIRVGTAPHVVVATGSLVRVDSAVADGELGAACPAVVALDEPAPFSGVTGVPTTVEIVVGEITPLEWILGH